MASPSTLKILACFYDLYSTEEYDYLDVPWYRTHCVSFFLSTTYYAFEINLYRMK